MKIDILADSGSPLGTVWQDIYGNAKDGRLGLGGAELALHTMCELWTDSGHEVVLYNSPKEPGHGVYSQLPVNSFQLDSPRDVLINFRTPSKRFISAVSGKKIWWSCDQFTEGNYRDFSHIPEKIVCISPTHKNFFKVNYSMDESKLHVVDLPVRRDYEDYSIKKIPGRFIFCSVPDRGLNILRNMWADVRKIIPEASLVITSDYRLWTNHAAGNERFRVEWFNQPDVQFLGAVDRNKLVREQMKADFMLYPCIYEELFCIAVAECITAGVFPITSDMGALSTTNEFSLKVPGNPFSREWQTAALHNIRLLWNNTPRNMEADSELENLASRFLPGNILRQWEGILN